MTQSNYIVDFVKQALAQGIPQTKVAELLNKAQEISNRQNTKTAGNNFDEVFSGLIKGAGLDKTNSSVAYTSGLIKESMNLGATPQQAIELTKHALYKTNQDLQLMQKM